MTKRKAERKTERKLLARRRLIVQLARAADEDGIVSVVGLLESALYELYADRVERGLPLEDVLAGLLVLEKAKADLMLYGALRHDRPHTPKAP